MKKIQVLVILLIATLGATVSYGQTTRANTNNSNAWLMYFGNHKLSPRIGIHLEAQFRRYDFLSESQQLLLRTGIDYYTKGNNRITVGYAFIETYPYGDFAVANAFPEHRIWQQFLTTQTIGKIKLTHRYRLEQRMLGNAATGEFSGGRYENRFRYMARVTMNVTSGEKPVYVAVYDEMMINFGKDVAYNIFDQNRLYGALGLTLSKDIRLEVGYLYQLLQLRSLDMTGAPKNRIENNHTFQLGLYSTLNFFKAEQ